MITRQLIVSILTALNLLRADTLPLTTYNGTPVVLDFNTPTPTPTFTPTPTPAPAVSLPVGQATPTSSPTTTPMPATSEQLDAWFTKYANHYSVDRSKLWKIAVCETGLRPNAVNWIYGGMFQFSPNTWAANRKIMGMDPNEDLRFNPEEAIRTGAFVLSTRGPSAWPSCAK